MNPLMKFTRQFENELNHEFIEILVFNYDGKGSALGLASYTDKEEGYVKSLEVFSLDDLELIFFGHKDKTGAYYARVLE